MVLKVPALPPALKEWTDEELTGRLEAVRRSIQEQFCLIRDYECEINRREGKR